MDIISRKEAKAKGMNKYYTGKSCKFGHIAKRFINGNCVKCNKIHGDNYIKHNKTKVKANNKKANERWNKLNPQKRKEIRKRYNDLNKEIINLKMVARYHSDIEKYRELGRQQAKKYPERYAANTMKRNAAKLQAIPLWYEDEMIKLLYLKRDELSKLWGITLHVDHIIPLQGKNVCGLHCWDNLQLLEASLNMSKGNKS